jgi:hypothetical protein
LGVPQISILWSDFLFLFFKYVKKLIFQNFSANDLPHVPSFNSIFRTFELKKVKVVLVDYDANNNNNNNNNNNSIFYNLCAESTVARPITDRTQSR